MVFVKFTQRKPKLKREKSKKEIRQQERRNHNKEQELYV